jgi:Tol biopolymer transport system component
VAIKLIAQKFATDPSRLRRFEQEARAAGQINHPNILAVYDIGSHAGTSYIVSELLEGESLASRLKSGALPARKAIDYARQAAEGLAAAHDKKLVHRDLKPDNLFLTNDARLKILDFGIAKLTLPGDDAARPTGFPTETADGIVVGTAGYMSPEQVRGEPVDVRSDLFSFGAVFYEMLTGRPAFVRETWAETMAAILKEEPPEPNTPTVTPGLVRIVSRCLEKKREARFQSARDLAFALEFLSSTTGTATAASAAVVAALRRWRTALSVAVGVLILSAAAATWWPRGAARPVIDDVFAGATFSTLTDWDGAEEGAEISPDGKFVAFLSDQAGEFDIWLKQIGSASWTNLTRNIEPLAPSGFVVRKLGFTADGSEIWFNPGDGKPPMKIPFGGGVPKPFLPAGTNTPAFSPDGAHIVYVDKAPGTDPIYLADPSGADPQVIFGPGPLKNMNPVFSQDGKWIYFTRASAPIDEVEMDVWRMRPTTGAPEPERLSEQHLAINFLAPLDARTLLYVARAEDRSGPWLWAFDVERRVSRRVPAGVHQFTSVSTSRDGRRIVATVASPSAGLWRVPVPVTDRIAVDREAVSYRLTSPTGQAWAPRFDSKSSLFYLSARGTGDGLWKDDGREAIDVWRGADGGLSEPPAVSPNGTRLVVVVRREGKRHLMIMEADGTRAQTLAGSIEIDGAAGQGAADWSPEGTRIVTAGHDAKGPALFVISVETGAITRLLEGAWVNPVWSPKNDLIVYGARSSLLGQVELRAIRPDGSAVQLPQVMARPGGYRFLPSGTGLVYVPRILSQEFWRLDVATGKVRQIVELEDRGTIRTFDITPDGKYLVFDRSRQNSNIVLIELQQPR